MSSPALALLEVAGAALVVVGLALLAVWAGCLAAGGFLLLAARAGDAAQRPSPVRAARR